MVLTVKHKFSIYRKYQLDIWGIAKTDWRWSGLQRFLKITKDRKRPFNLIFLFKHITSYFVKFFFEVKLRRELRKKKSERRYVYVLEKAPVKKWYKKTNWRFVSIRITRLYYFSFQDYQFRKLFRKATKLDGNMESNYLHLIEGRVLGIVYRTNLLRNMFRIVDYIKGGNVFFESKCINTVNTRVPVTTFIFFNLKHQPLFLYKLKRRLLAKRVLFNTPRFLFMSYKFFFCFLHRLPQKKDLIYPIYIDMYRLTGYY